MFFLLKHNNLKFKIDYAFGRNCKNKNCSSFVDSSDGPVFSPAYDLLSTVLINPVDDEDLALYLNGKKKKINRKDFESAFSSMKLNSKQQVNIFTKMEKAKEKWIDFIQISFLNDDFKEKYIQLIHERFNRLK